MKIPSYEIGAAICRCGDTVRLGKFFAGDRNSVKVPIRCRSGCKPVGTFHTHPGGPVYLSRKDVDSIQKANLEIGCVSDGERMRCYRIKRK
jgi:proteasome lid subunit RPN8/RPN11